MKDVNCPYCGHAEDINHDDGYGYEEDDLHQQECGQCEKVYGFNTSIVFYYDAARVPCFNGEPHKEVPNKVLRAQGWPDAIRCIECDHRNDGAYAPPEKVKP